MIGACPGSAGVPGRPPRGGTPMGRGDRSSPSPNGRNDVTRNLVLGLMVAALVLLAGGAALAATINCTGGECRGTAEDDKITGTGGNDQIFGLRGRDQITGDPFGSKAGNDELRGGGGNDFIV